MFVSCVERKTLLSPGTGSVNLHVCVRVYGGTTCTSCNTTTRAQTLWVSQINIGTIVQLRKYELHSLLSCENVLRVTATDPPRDLRGYGIYGVALQMGGSGQEGARCWNTFSNDSLTYWTHKIPKFTTQAQNIGTRVIPEAILFLNMIRCLIIGRTEAGHPVFRW